MTSRRILSLVVALVATLLGYLSLFGGGVPALQRANTLGRGGFDVSLVVPIVLGLALLAVAALTAAVSSLGVIVVGAVHLVLSLVLILAPNNGLFSVLAVVPGLFFVLPTGIGMLAAAVLVATGPAARLRRTRVPGVNARVATLVIAAVCTAIGVPLVLVAGLRLYADLMQFARPGADPLSVVLVILGALLVAVAAFTIRWSSLGALVAGGIVAVIGLVGVVAPLVLPRALIGGIPELASALTYAGPTGNLALIGVLLAAAGAAAVLRARRLPVVVVAPADAGAAASA